MRDTQAAAGVLNLHWAEALVDALSDGGVRDACIAPGSRSAPLVFALDRSTIRTHVALDERAGAYFALGLAKGGRRPAAIVTTSGTAAANLFPAVVEAAHGRVPLVAITADRPADLRAIGAPQTIDQTNLFGGFPRWFCDLGEPVEDETMRARALAARAVAQAWGPPAGPVHLNCPFREPLTPPTDALSEPGVPAPAAARPLGPATTGREPESGSAVDRVARCLRANRRGLILCGPGDPPEEYAAAVIRLAAATGYPVLADPASGLRFGPHVDPHILGAYDLFLRTPGFAERQAPEVLLQLDTPLTSRSYHLFAARHPRAIRIAVDGAGRPRDPMRGPDDVVAADPLPFASALANRLGREGEPLPSWLESFRRAEDATIEILRRRSVELDRRGTIDSEDEISATAFGALRDGDLLYVGNSMPIRDLDQALPPVTKRIRVLANRGVNGIDGVLSSALGASASTGQPVLAILGDLSFHHDLNGLAALREGRARATIIVVHNDGGGIFSFLPVADHGALYERAFATPHGLDFEPAAALYGLSYARVARATDLRERVESSLRQGTNQLIEIRINREVNRACHRALWSEIIDAVDTV